MSTLSSKMKMSILEALSWFYLRKTRRERKGNVTIKPITTMKAIAITGTVQILQIIYRILLCGMRILLVITTILSSDDLLHVKANFEEGVVCRFGDEVMCLYRGGPQYFSTTITTPDITAAGIATVRWTFNGSLCNAADRVLWCKVALSQCKKRVGQYLRPCEQYHEEPIKTTKAPEIYIPVTYESSPSWNKEDRSAADTDNLGLILGILSILFCFGGAGWVCFKTFSSVSKFDAKPFNDVESNVASSGNNTFMEGFRTVKNNIQYGIYDPNTEEKIPFFERCFMVCRYCCLRSPVTNRKRPDGTYDASPDSRKMDSESSLYSRKLGPINERGLLDLNETQETLYNAWGPLGSLKSGSSFFSGTLMSSTDLSGTIRSGAFTISTLTSMPKVTKKWVHELSRNSRVRWFQRTWKNHGHDDIPGEPYRRDYRRSIKQFKGKVARVLHAKPVGGISCVELPKDFDQKYAANQFHQRSKKSRFRKKRTALSISRYVYPEFRHGSNYDRPPEGTICVGEETHKKNKGYCDNTYRNAAAAGVHGGAQPWGDRNSPHRSAQCVQESHGFYGNAGYYDYNISENGDPNDSEYRRSPDRKSDIYDVRTAGVKEGDRDFQIGSNSNQLKQSHLYSGNSGNQGMPREGFGAEGIGARRPNATSPQVGRSPQSESTPQRDLTMGRSIGRKQPVYGGSTDNLNRSFVQTNADGTFDEAANRIFEETTTAITQYVPQETLTTLSGSFGDTFSDSNDTFYEQQVVQKRAQKWSAKFSYRVNKIRRYLGEKEERAAMRREKAIYRAQMRNQNALSKEEEEWRRKHRRFERSDIQAPNGNLVMQADGSYVAAGSVPPSAGGQNMPINAQALALLDRAADRHDGLHISERQRLAMQQKATTTEFSITSSDVIGGGPGRGAGGHSAGRKGGGVRSGDEESHLSIMHANEPDGYYSKAQYSAANEYQEREQLAALYYQQGPSVYVRQGARNGAQSEEDPKLFHNFNAMSGKKQRPVTTSYTRPGSTAANGPGSASAAGILSHIRDNEKFYGHLPHTATGGNERASRIYLDESIEDAMQKNTDKKRAKLRAKQPEIQIPSEDVE